MIKHDSQLKIQALLDDEMSAREAAEVEGLLASDPEARALFAELRNTKTALATGEAECRMPETREFFWSKIEREISREAPVAAIAPKSSWLAWLRRRWLPVGSTAAVLVCAAMMPVFRSHSHSRGFEPGEMELASDEMGSYVFRDQKQQMTMVWFYDRNAEEVLAKPTSMVSSGRESDLE